MSTIDYPAPKRGDSVAVVRLVAFWDQVMVGFHPQRSRQFAGIQAEPVYVALTIDHARTILSAEAAMGEIRSAPAFARPICWGGCMKVRINDVFKTAYRRLSACVMA